MNSQNSIISAPLALAVGLAVVSGCASALSETSFSQESHILQTHIEDNLIVPVVIGGKTYSFLVDTGASLTVIDSKLAKRITTPIAFRNLPKHYQKDFESIKTVSGKLENEDITFLKPVPISIGKKDIVDHEVWVSLDMALSSQAVGVDLGGIIGIDTFRQMNWFIDNAKQSLTVLDDAPSSAQFKRCLGYSDSYNRSPVLDLGYENGSISVRVDTGASDGYLGQEFIDYLLQNTDSITRIPKASLSADANGLQYTDEYVLSGLKFNDMPIGDIQVSGNAGEQYALGMDFFSRFQQYAFMPSKMMFCYNADSIEEEWKRPYRTIYTRHVNQKLEVFYNPESIYDEYGLKNGDIILKVNGEAFKPSQIKKLGKVLSHTPKGKLSIMVSRGRENKIIQL